MRATYYQFLCCLSCYAIATIRSIHAARMWQVSDLRLAAWLIYVPLSVKIPFCIFKPLKPKDNYMYHLL
jgi:hypothetical protein